MKIKKRYDRHSGTKLFLRFSLNYNYQRPHKKINFPKKITPPPQYPRKLQPPPALAPPPSHSPK